MHFESHDTLIEGLRLHPEANGESTALHRPPSASTRRKIAEKSTPEAITTQEGVDGYREQAMRIAGVERFELGKRMELSIMGHVLKWARQSNLFGGPLRTGDGWNLKNHSHLAVVRHLREKTHPSMLVVTIREGEERGICSAALKELLKIVKDQIEERSVVVIVLNTQSAIWKDASMKTLVRCDQLNYIDVEGMTVVTNNRCVAEHIKSDKVETVATGGFGEVGKLAKDKN